MTLQMLKFDSEQTKRLKKLFRYAGFLALFVLTCVFLSHYGLGIPCLFYQVTGWYCPGCEVTRMGLALLRGDLEGAWQANPVLLLLLPYFTGLLMLLSVRYVRSGRVQLDRLGNRVLYAVIGLLLVFSVWRNVV